MTTTQTDLSAGSAQPCADRVANRFTTADLGIPEQRTHHTATRGAHHASTPRVWLVAGLGAAPDPTDAPTVRDHQMRVWWPGADGCWHTPDGRHHATWAELHARFDLVEVTS